jgi:hypothetical protein
MLTKRPAAAALAGALCLPTAACGASSSPTARTAAKANAPGYPVTIKNCGQTTTYGTSTSRPNPATSSASSGQDIRDKAANRIAGGRQVLAGDREWSVPARKSYLPTYPLIFTVTL